MYRSLLWTADRTTKAFVGVTAVAFGQAAHHANTYVPLPELHATDAGRVLPQKLRERREKASAALRAHAERFRRTATELLDTLKPRPKRVLFVGDSLVSGVGGSSTEAVRGPPLARRVSRLLADAYGVEVERGISVTKAPQALDRDIGEDCEIELMFPSINAVVLRLQRFGSIIDAMRDVGVSNAKMREFVHGSSVIDISSTPIMAQAAPEIGVEVAVIAFRRELPRSVGFKTIKEFRLAFAARLNTYVPPYVHVNDSKQELICDVCFPGHDVPCLWPVSLLLKSTGATELTARQSNIANDSILAWLRSATNLNILQTHLSFHINKCAFMSQNVAPRSGPTLPDREIFVTASQNRSGWPAFTARENHMPHCMDVWINPFSSQYLSDVVPEIFSPHTTIPVSLSTPSSLPSYVKDLSEGDLFLGAGSNPFEDLDHTKNISPSCIRRLSSPETIEPSKRAKIDSQEKDEPAPVLGSRVTAEGIQSAAKRKSSQSDASKLKSRIAKTCGVKSSDIPEHLTTVCALIEAGQYQELTCTRRNSLEKASMEAKRRVKNAETLKTPRTKQGMIEYISTLLKLRKNETKQS